MEVLLRKHEGKYYIWKKATYEHGYFVVEGIRIGQERILATKDDNRKDYVTCAYCGAVINNNPESIEAHFTEEEAKRDCFKCSSMRINSKKSVKANIVDRDGNLLTVQETYEADLRCGQSWSRSPSIASDDAKKVCVYYRCRNSGVQAIEDAFIKYPGLFDKHITVDVLTAKGYVCDGYINGFFEYDLKSRNTVKACVNELGVVDHFIVKHRGYKFVAYYSPKYDKLFFVDNYRRDYEERIPSPMSETKYNQAKAKIASIYKEEKTDE